MQAPAASEASGCTDRQKRACKPRANCLNPKRKLKIAPVTAIVTLTYRTGEPLLKADVAKQENLRGARSAQDKRSAQEICSRNLPKTNWQIDRIMILDSETKAVELPHEHGDELRLWLRLLTCTTLIEGEVRSRLRERFDVTLPRFDLMAQLDKVPEGMTLSDVSKRMMVSNGNVTGLVERLVESGHLDRRTSDTDRRVQVIRLTKAGRVEFRKMAAEHETWIADIFSDLAPKDVRELMRLLAKTKASAQKSAQARAL
jgi:DNA-binding MarR family transcriptional regulator